MYRRRSRRTIPCTGRDGDGDEEGRARTEVAGQRRKVREAPEGPGGARMGFPGLGGKTHESWYEVMSMECCRFLPRTRRPSGPTALGAVPPYLFRRAVALRWNESASRRSRSSGLRRLMGTVIYSLRCWRAAGGAASGDAAARVDAAVRAAASESADQAEDDGISGGGQAVCRQAGLCVLRWLLDSNSKLCGRNGESGRQPARKRLRGGDDRPKTPNRSPFADARRRRNVGETEVHVVHVTASLAPAPAISARFELDDCIAALRLESARRIRPAHFHSSPRFPYTCPGLALVRALDRRRPRGTLPGGVLLPSGSSLVLHDMLCEKLRG